MGRRRECPAMLNFRHLLIFRYGKFSASLCRIHCLHSSYTESIVAMPCLWHCLQLEFGVLVCFPAFSSSLQAATLSRLVCVPDFSSVIDQCRKAFPVAANEFRSSDMLRMNGAIQKKRITSELEKLPSLPSSSPLPPPPHQSPSGRN